MALLAPQGRSVTPIIDTAARRARPEDGGEVGGSPQNKRADSMTAPKRLQTEMNEEINAIWCAELGGKLKI